MDRVVTSDGSFFPNLSTILSQQANLFCLRRLFLRGQVIGRDLSEKRKKETKFLRDLTPLNKIQKQPKRYKFYLLFGRDWFAHVWACQDIKFVVSSRIVLKLMWPSLIWLCLPTPSNYVLHLSPWRKSNQIEI